MPDVPILVWGATGQGRVATAALEALGRRVFLFVDCNPSLSSPRAGIPIVHDREALEGRLTGPGWAFVAAVGGDRGCDRVAIDRYLTRLGGIAASWIHPTAHVDSNATIGPGAQVAIGASIASGVVLGRQCMVNTGAVVDHDTRLGEGVHVMPGAVLAGEVSVNRLATVGTNATVLPRIQIGESAFVGAGAVVTRDVEAGTVVVGVPARRIREAHRQSVPDSPWEE